VARASTAGAAPARDACRRLSLGGAAWLARHQNADGGWGDTLDSPSNISTTVLGWAALHAIEGDQVTVAARARADAWVDRAAGGREASTLADAIAGRYGDDRTFSVPILTMCALAGRLGPDARAWRHVAQLPFELATFPQSWFRYLHLPVVSYALPALIAIGQVRHHRRPTRNPLLRALRYVVHRRTRRVLERIQPPGGGFLEATPLTSFVLMSLAGSAQADSPVAVRAAQFLARSVRDDGSWPIDTNLATWVTTLSIQSLAAGGMLSESLSVDEQQTVKAWLLGQQYRRRHPYTGAAPGGWAWTDLPGGVPDADDTAGALVALHQLGATDAVAHAAQGIRWLLGLQNSDGGVPTFCRGWGRLPFDRSTPEITAHALTAWSLWRDRLPASLTGAVDRATQRALQYLQREQHPDGAWVPLWFGSQHVRDEQNPTYGTARVVATLSCCHTNAGDALHASAARGVAWLVAAQNADGGWGAATGVPSTVEETGQAVRALSAARTAAALIGPDVAASVSAAIDRGTRWIARATHNGTHFAAAPIGLYFARLWYAEQLYPQMAAVAALGSAARSRPAE
jgi:squalene-hopene/tetraprenyl-beta-curcumene cyclase